MAGSARTRATTEPLRAGIIDVAGRAGVSVATVSRALRGLPNVSAGTRAKVMAAAAELEYTASPLAAALVTGRTRSVAVLVPDTGSWYSSEALRGIETGLRATGYNLLLHVLTHGRHRDAFFAGLPVRRRADAVVVAGLCLTTTELHALQQLSLPLAVVGEAPAGVHAERIDDEEAAAALIEHLIDGGHTRIAMIGSDARAQRAGAAARMRGFATAMASAGLAAVAVPGGSTPAGGAAATTRLLAGRPAPTAVVCWSDEVALGSLAAVRAAGLRCPDDVAVAGFGDHELAGPFGLTTVADPVADQGEAAARWLTAGLEAGRPASWSGREHEHDGRRGAACLHPFRLVVRTTTVPGAGPAVSRSPG